MRVGLCWVDVHCRMARPGDAWSWPGSNRLELLETFFKFLIKRACKPDRFPLFSGRREAIEPLPAYTNMSKQVNTTESARSVSKETMERHQEQQATAIGCDEKKTVSGFEYLLILIRAMVKEGIIAPSDLATAAAMAKGMKANNSALRQWLYERAEKADKPSAIASKYLEM